MWWWIAGRAIHHVVHIHHSSLLPAPGRALDFGSVTGSESVGSFFGVFVAVFPEAVLLFVLLLTVIVGLPFRAGFGAMLASIDVVPSHSCVAPHSD